MNQVNRLVISRRDFKNEDELYAKVAQITRVLLESEYLVLLHDADEIALELDNLDEEDIDWIVDNYGEDIEYSVGPETGTINVRFY